MPVYKKDIVPGYSEWSKEQKQLLVEKGEAIKSMYTDRGIADGEELAYEHNLRGFKLDARERNPLQFVWDDQK